MYQALYRKWRPRTFDELSGQTHITKILRKQCEENRVAHAYLFCGTRGTGKTSAAKILAKAINCEHPVNGNPCNECDSCKLIDSGNATDVQEIDAASNNGVDDIRSLRDEVVYPPSALKKRVYIIDEVHMLSAGAFNALLKTLEEPPEYIVFILATTELNKLPATIVSRCIRFDFTRLSEEIIAARLRFVAEQEQIRLGEGAAELLARLADGAMRDGLSILEACTSGTEHEITAQSVRERLGIAGADQLVTFYRNIAEKNVSDALSVLEDVYRSSKDLSVFWEDAASMVRDLLILKQLKGDVRGYAGSFRFREEACSLLKDYPEVFTPELLLYFCSVIEDTQSRMTRYTTNKKLLLEFAVIQLCDPSLSISPRALTARISRLEKQPHIGSSAVVSEPNVSPQKQEEAKQSAQEEPKQVLSEAKPFTQVAELAEELMGHPDLLPYVQKIQAVLENGTFVITADSFTNRMLQNGTNEQTLRDAVRVVTGQPYELVFREQKKQNTAETLIDEL